MDPELREALISTLKTLEESRSKKQSKAGKILNSPFTVTILGGLLLALVSALFTHSVSQYDKERELALEQLRKKQAFVEAFTSNIERYLELTFSVRKREIFLAAWQGKPNPAAYPDHRNFEQTRDCWEEEKRYWLDHSTSSPAGLVYSAEILFKKPAAHEKLEELYSATDRYGHAASYTDLQNAYDETLKALAAAATSMADEVYEK